MQLPLPLPMMGPSIPSPLCPWFPLCPRRGRATVGPWVAMGPNVRNRTVTCRTCSRSGEQSENLGRPGDRGGKE